MFAKKFRLPGKTRFTALEVVRTPLFQVKIAQNKEMHNRYGFVTSKKIDNRATVRNMLKRQFRGHVEKLHPKIKTSYDVLFILQKQALTAEKDVLKNTIEKALQEKKLL